MRYAIRTNAVSEHPMFQLVDFPAVMVTQKPYSPPELKSLLNQAYISIAHAYIQQRKLIPVPVTAGVSYLDLNSTVAQKVLLHNLLVEKKMKRVDLRVGLRLSTSEMSRVFDLKMNTNPNTMLKAFDLLGYSIEVKLVSVPHIRRE